MKTLKIEMDRRRFRELVLAIGIIDDQWLKKERGLGYYPTYFDLNNQSALTFREWLDDTERVLAHEHGAINLLPFFNKETFGGNAAESIMFMMTYHRLNKDYDNIEGLKESITMESNERLMDMIDADWDEIKEATILMVNDLIEEQVRP
ncbi:MAG: hypothetical protein V5A57_03620 [Candidatus Paceibacterota bacterium]